MAAPDRQRVAIREFFYLLLTGVGVFVLTGWVGIGVLEMISCERLGGAFEGRCGWVGVSYLVEYGTPTALLLWVLVWRLVARWLRRPRRRQVDAP